MNSPLTPPSPHPAQGKVILITGGSRGIGAATARLAAALGYQVAITYRVQARAAQQVVQSIQEPGGKAFAIAADMAVEADVVRVFDTVDSHFGRLDALVNNAGLLEQQSCVQTMAWARLERVFAANVFGVFACCQQAVRRMSTAHGGAGGAIVNLSSTAARLGAPNEYVDYAASKAAVNALTIGLAKEVATQGIRVNAVAPGVIDTEIHATGGEPNRIERVKSTIPMQRGGTSDEVAQAVMWLLSDQASFTTGTIVDVSGGR